MTTTTARTAPPPLRGPILAGLAIVGIAAAILSFGTLDALAKSAGYTADWCINLLPGPGGEVDIYVSWLVPVTIDVFGGIATAAWLLPSLDMETRRYARVVAIADIVLSAALNAALHGMHAAGWLVAECWPLVIGVGAIPPIALAFAIHLGAKVLDQRPAVPGPAAAAPSLRPAAGPVPQVLAVAPTPAGPVPVEAVPGAQPWPDLDLLLGAVDADRARDEALAEADRVRASARAERTRSRTREAHPNAPAKDAPGRTRKPGLTRTRKAPAGAPAKGAPAYDDEAIRVWLRARATTTPDGRPTTPGSTALRRAHPGLGGGRADRLINEVRNELADQPPALEVAK
jgi:hypothetical protein